MDNKNLTQTYLKLRGRLKTLASSILQNEEDADDALQDAFCRLLSRNEENEPSLVDGMAVVTVKRICISYLRKRNVRASESIDDSASELESPPEILWENKEIEDMTRLLMSKLSPLQKSVFDLVCEGVDYDIISARLGITEEAVRQNICRARKILRNEYKRFQ